MNYSHKLIAVVALCAAVVLPNIAVAQVPGLGTWETTLEGRYLSGDFSNGFDAYYDTVLDITWLADTNYAQTSGHHLTGLMTAQEASAWAAGLTLGGYTEWQLPTSAPVDGSDSMNLTLSYDGTTDVGFNIAAPGTLYAGSTANSLAHMYYVTLGFEADIAGADIGGYRECLGSSFLSNDFCRWWYLGRSSSCSSNLLPAMNNCASRLNFDSGQQDIYAVDAEGYAWLIHPGDVGVVPEPTTALVFAGGLLVLARRRRRENA